MRPRRHPSAGAALGTPPEARRQEPGPPPCVFCTVGWQYREYLTEEQRSSAGCSAG